ncbi:hypothetical protein [Nocardia africana]|uniref:Uncharacterized protein n=1 Tax=Nocardia africana TaxID=134964 RepID=A0ABW6NKH3_9NOCA
MLSERGIGVSDRVVIVWVGPEVDVDRMLRTDCPECGREARVRGTATHLLVVDHLRRDGRTCMASNAEIRKRVTGFETSEDGR